MIPIVEADIGATYRLAATHLQEMLPEYTAVPVSAFRFQEAGIKTRRWCRVS